MRVDEIADELAVLVAGLEPGCYRGPDAARLACSFERVERLAATAKTLLARRAVECGEWSKAGARTAAGWLSDLWGVPQGAAQGALTLAEAAAHNPDLDQAMRSGELSAAQAGEVAAAACSDPSSTKKMISNAKTRGFKGLREERRAVQSAARCAEDDTRRAQHQHKSRYLRTWADAEGCGRLDARLAPADFACFKAYLVPFEREAFQAARAEGRWESFDAYRADALLAMAEASCYPPDHQPQPQTPFPATANPPAEPAEPVTAEGAASGDGSIFAGIFDDPQTPFPAGGHAPRDPSDDQPGDDQPGDDQLLGVTDAPPASPPPPSAVPPSAVPPNAVPPGAEASDAVAHGLSARPAGRRVPVEVVVVVDYQALIRGHTQDGEVCYVEGFGPVPVAVARRFMQDSFVAVVLKNGVDIRKVVHLGRRPTRMQMTALRVRDPRCVVPGCESTEGLEVDHIPEWEHTHHTTLDELARECAFHHDQRTYQGATLTGGPGHWHWTPPPPRTLREPPPTGPIPPPPPGPPPAPPPP